MSVTRSQMAVRILRRAGILGVGDTPTSAQESEALQLYDEFYETLEDYDLADWSANGDIPNKYVDDIINLCVFRGAEDFGISGERFQRIAVKASQSERSIRAINARGFIYTPVSIE